MENQSYISGLWNKKALTVNEAAECTGLKASQIRYLAKAGKMPHSRANNKTLFFDSVELREWLESGKKGVGLEPEPNREYQSVSEEELYRPSTSYLRTAR